MYYVIPYGTPMHRTHSDAVQCCTSNVIITIPVHVVKTFKNDKLSKNTDVPAESVLKTDKYTDSYMLCVITYIFYGYLYLEANKAKPILQVWVRAGIKRKSYAHR